MSANTSATVVGRSSVRSGLQADRVFAGLRVAPFAVSVAISLVLVLAFVLLMWGTGRFESLAARKTNLWDYRDFRIALLVALLAGYLPAARQAEVRSAARNRLALEGVLSARASDPSSFVRLDPRSATTAGIVGTSVVPLTAILLDQDLSLYGTSAYWRAEAVYEWLVGGFAGFWFGSFVYVALTYARRFSRLADALREPDLLDTSPVRPFAGHGLSSALLWLVLVSIVALNAVDLVWFGVMAGLAVTVGVAALMWPVQGVHRRLRAAKRAELARIHRALRGDASALSDSPLRERAALLSVADLLSYRAFVESAREWPFDAFTFVRFALYLVLPLGSWLGGALVERLLGAALD